MTDIVERLRRIACKHSETTDVAVVMGQAADEIERLRSLLHEGIDATMSYGDDGTIAYWRSKVRAALGEKP